MQPLNKTHLFETVCNFDRTNHNTLLAVCYNNVLCLALLGK